VTTPRVAIITPTYRHARFIDACLDSVISQTIPDWELVVVDDGSDDGTPDRVRERQDGRIRLIERPHLGLVGLGAAYASGLAATTAPLVAVLEGDDLWPVQKLEKQLPLLDEPGVVLSYGRAVLVDWSGRTYATYGRRPAGAAGLNVPTGSIARELVSNFIVASTVVVRRTALERIGGFWQPPGIDYVDHPTWLRLALEGRFAWCDSVMGIWRRHAGQYTTRRSVEVAPPDRRPYLREIRNLAVDKDLDLVVASLDGLIATDAHRQTELFTLEAARLSLLARNRTDALRLFVRYADRKRPSTVAIAGLGALAASLGQDVEWFFRALDRFSWPSTHR